MQHMVFGRNSGLRVSQYALGTGNFGTRWGAGADETEACSILDRFADANGTLIDTAESYQFGESEEILGRLLVGRRDRFTLTTKVSNGVSPDAGVMNTGNSRKNMVRAVEASLRRLRTDRIDLLWVHFPDTVTPTEEIIRTLEDLVCDGKILHGGLSNFPAWRTSRAAAIAELRGYVPLAGVQLEYSLVERTGDRDVLPMAEALGLGVALWSPLGGGLLTGKYRGSARGRFTDWQRLVHVENSERKTAVLDAVLAVSDEAGASPAQVAMAWLLGRAADAATTFVPIIGPRTLSQLEDYLGALSVRLDDRHRHSLDEVSRIALGQPHELIEGHRPVILGGQGTDFRDLRIPMA